MELWQGRTQAVIACKQLETRRRRCLAVDREVEGTRVPDTDQSWGPGEVLQLGQAGMRFGRQVDNII